MSTSNTFRMLSQRISLAGAHSLQALGRTLADSQRAAQANSLALPMTASVVSASTSDSATPS